LAADPSASAAVADIRETANWLSDSFKREPDVGLTAIHVASIERQLARHAEVDAPQPVSLPLRRNWGLWGSVAASTLIVATVMASILPRVFQEGHAGSGSGGNGTSGGDQGSVPTVSPGTGSGGPIVATSPGGAIGKVAGGDGTSASDWPILKTSAGGLPWPSFLYRPTGFYEPAFVTPADFPLAIIPRTPVAVPGKGSLHAIQSSLSAGRLPSPQSVRADELINALNYQTPVSGVPAAAESAGPVSAIVESAVCPWDAAHRLVRITVRTSGRPGTAPGTVDPETIVPFAPEIVPLVRDLRLVAEVNPAAAVGYRLIGYENGPRSWGEWSGRNDGEVVAPGTVFTALLEVVPTGQQLPESSRPAEARRYARPESKGVSTDELLTISVEFAEGPDARPVRIDLPVSASATPVAATTTDYRAAAGAAALGLSLRRENPAVDPLLETSIRLLSEVTAVAPADDRQNLLDLARKVRSLGK